MISIEEKKFIELVSKIIKAYKFWNSCCLNLLCNIAYNLMPNTGFKAFPPTPNLIARVAFLYPIKM